MRELKNSISDQLILKKAWARDLREKDELAIKFYHNSDGGFKVYDEINKSIIEYRLIYDENWNFYIAQYLHRLDTRYVTVLEVKIYDNTLKAWEFLTRTAELWEQQGYYVEWI